MADPRTSRRYRRTRATVLATSNVCWLCQMPGADTVDHIIPISRGGDPFDISNMQPAHKACNSRRGARPAQPSRRTRQWL